MAKADYVTCDVCDCKCIYDGDWTIRDAGSGDRMQGAMKGGKFTYSCICGECLAKQEQARAAAGEEWK